MLTFFRREPFTLQAQYTSPSTFPDPIIGHYTIENVGPGPEGECQKVNKLDVTFHFHKAKKWDEEMSKVQKYIHM